jgi:esterase
VIVAQLEVPAGTLAVTEWLGEGPTVVALHGLAHAGSVWAGTAEALGGSVRLIAPDLRGHGGSLRTGPEGYRLDRLVDDALAVIDAYASGGSFLVGHSLGGRVAAEIALRGLAPLEATLLVDTPPTVPQAARRRIADLHRSAGAGLTAQQYIDILSERHPFARRDLLSILARSTAGPDPLHPGRVAEQTDRSFVEAWRAGDFDLDWPARVGEAPILLARGLASAVTPRGIGIGLVEAGTVDRVAVVAGAGHDVPLDNPSGLAEVIRELTEAVEARR